jgi:Flp pilus assembly protein TadG
MPNTPISHFRSRNRQRGSAMVEMSLLLPVILGLAVGVADFARVTYFSVAVNNAARAGAQYGMRERYTDVAGMTAAAVQDATNVPGFRATNVTATHYCTCSGGAVVACSMASCAGEPAGPYVFVDVQTNYTFNTLLNYRFAGIPPSVALNGRARIRAR